MQLIHSDRGFTLMELAVVMTIVALLIAGAMATLSSQVDTRNNDETTRRLNAAVDAINGFAIVNKRLPCPAVSGATGVESPSGGGTCTTNFGGYVPALTIGLQPTDSSGYAVDTWGNRLRYAVASAITGCTGTSTTPHFTSSANLKGNGISCKPNDIDVCTTITNNTGVSACTATTRAVSNQTVAYLVFSTGKNGGIVAAYGNDELENTDGDAAFVLRTPTDSTYTNGTYDDLMVVVPVGIFYSKLINAGVLP